jgi:hypothetical protein
MNGYRQGCQIFLGPKYQYEWLSAGPKYQNGEKYTKLTQNIPNGHKIFAMGLR